MGKKRSVSEDRCNIPYFIVSYVRTPQKLPNFEFPTTVSLSPRLASTFQLTAETKSAT